MLKLWNVFADVRKYIILKISIHPSILAFINVIQFISIIYHYDVFQMKNKSGWMYLEYHNVSIREESSENHFQVSDYQ